MKNCLWDLTFMFPAFGAANVECKLGNPFKGQPKPPNRFHFPSFLLPPIIIKVSPKGFLFTLQP
jgi:hypothetical protein